MFRRILVLRIRALAHGTEVPRLNYDEVQFRLYVRLFGHKRRAASILPARGRIGRSEALDS